LPGMNLRWACLVAYLLAGAACRGERPAAQAAAADSTRVDSTARSGDSMMARDTARPQ